MNVLRPVAILVALFVLAACSPPDTADSGQAPTWAEAANLSFEGVADTPVTLSDGRWEEQPAAAGGASRQRVGLVEDFSLTGDLNNDGAAETVVLLWSSSGGSGTFDYLAVVGRDVAGNPQNIATAALGDRPKLRSATIENATIILHTVEAGLDDAACCPGQKLIREFVLTDAGLQETVTRSEGRLSVTDLGGTEWRLEQFARGEPVPADAEITLIFDGQRIAGKSACNRYMGGITVGLAPGDFSVNEPIGGTMMACPPPLDELERRYLTRLQGVVQYSFVAGKLALNWAADGTGGTLLFSPQSKVSTPE